MKNNTLLLLLFVLNSCQPTTNDISEVQNASSMNRFERYIAAFPSVELPYSLSSSNQFPTMDPEFVEHIMLVKNDAQIGLTKTVQCIATFKTGTHLAVLYKWSERPITPDNPTFYELSVYSPYGALRKSIILGQEQIENDAYQEHFNVRIEPNFLITTEHHVTHFLNTSDKYQSFYSNQFQITEDGQITTTKKAALWEKVPTEFTPSFVEGYKKNPTENPRIKMTIEGNKTILENPELGYAKAIFQPYNYNGRPFFLVSSLEVEAYSQTQTTLDPYYVNSRLTLLEWQENQFKIVTNKILDTAKWVDIYTIIKASCACEPAPNINDNGIIGLTSLEEVVSNAVYADLDTSGKLVLKCRKENEQEQVIHTF